MMMAYRIKARKHMQTRCFPSVIKSSRTRARGFPRRVKRPTGTVPTGQSGCFAWTWFMRLHLFLGTSFFGPELQILDIRGKKSNSGRWPSVKICKMTSGLHLFFLKKKNKNTYRHMREFGMRGCLAGGCLPLNCRRLLLDGSRWVEQMGCSCLL